MSAQQSSIRPLLLQPAARGTKSASAASKQPPSSSASSSCCRCCSSSCCSRLSFLSPRRHLSTRLAYLTLLLVSIYLIVIVVTVNFLTQKLIHKQTGEKYQDLAYQTSNLLDRIMFERYREAQTIASLPQAYSNSGDDAILNTLQSTFTNYAWIGLTNAQGIVIASTGHLLHGVNVTARPWWQITDATRAPFVGDLHDAKLLATLLPKLPDGSPQRFVDIAVPLFFPAVPCINITDSSTNITSTNCTNSHPPIYNGVLGFHLSWIWAGDLRSQVLQAQSADDDVQLLILDQTGLILLGDDSPGATVTAGTTLSTDSVVAAQQGSATDTTSLTGYHSDSYSDGTWITGYAKSRGYNSYPGLGWIVLVRQYEATALAPATFLQMIILLIVILLGVLLTACITISIAIAVKPLVEISQKANAITQQLCATSGSGKDGDGKNTKDGKKKSKKISAVASSSNITSLTVSSLAPITVTLPVTSNTTDEVGALSLSLRSLLSILNSHRHELQSMNAQLEVKVQSRTIELEMINRELEMFSQTVSHDLRAPLGSIRSSTELLQGDIASPDIHYFVPPTTQEYLTQILSDVTACNVLITDLLELSRINHSTLRIKPVDLIQMAQGIVNDLQRSQQERAKHVTVIWPVMIAPPTLKDVAGSSVTAGSSSSSTTSSASGSFAASNGSSLTAASSSQPDGSMSGIPKDPSSPSSSTTAPFIVPCDEGLVRVVLTNLLSNAWKYSSRRPHSIIEFGRVEVLNSQGHYAYYVRDNGSGFDMNHAKRLFKPFQRMHTQSEFAGVGVGLATVSRCCQRHNGKIWAKAKKNVGASFFFTLEENTGAGDESLSVRELPPLPTPESLGIIVPPSSIVAPSSASSSLLPPAPTPLSSLPSPSTPNVASHPKPTTSPSPNSFTRSLLKIDVGNGTGKSSLPVPLPLAHETAPTPSGNHHMTVTIHGLKDEINQIEEGSPNDADADEKNGDVGGVRVPYRSLDTSSSPQVSTSPPPVSIELIEITPAVSNASTTAPAASSASSASSSAALSAMVSPVQRARQKKGKLPLNEEPARILFVDDSFINCKLGSRILSSNGMIVDTANDGTEVVNMLYPHYHAQNEVVSPQGEDDMITPQNHSSSQLSSPNTPMQPSRTGAESFNTGLSNGVSHISDDQRENNHLMTPLHTGLMHRRTLTATNSSVQLMKVYDVIFMDLTMPVMDGITCCTLLRQLGYPNTIVALTGHDDAAKKEECASIFDAFMSKPYPASELIATVEKYRGKISRHHNPNTNGSSSSVTT